MTAFIMLTKITAGPIHAPHNVEMLERRVMEQVRVQCPEVTWRASYGILGPYDYIDIFTAPNIESATKVSMLFRSYGHAQAEVWPAVEWQTVKDLASQLPSRWRQEETNREEEINTFAAFDTEDVQQSNRRSIGVQERLERGRKEHPGRNITRESEDAYRPR